MTQALHLYLIKPTRYDRDGYPIQWRQSLFPSNSLAAVTALVEEAAGREVLGPGVKIDWRAMDETNADVPIDAIIAAHRAGQRVAVFLVGVQTNQYPRAMDLARPLRAAGVPVCLGGFHASGCIAMLGRDCEELSLARELGVSLFAGEAEERRLDKVLQDAYNGAFEAYYDFSNLAPALGGEPVPILPAEVVRRNVNHIASFDLGRGCPFECSFCTIINVQGRKSRYRDVEDMEALIRRNYARGITYFFVTDDNLARNRIWESYADRLIEMREKEGIKVRLTIQVDTMAHRIPRFIEKMCRAGADIIFIGLENINPDNLEAVKKRQNRIEEYREMMQAWKAQGCIITCGYMVGFPKDTAASIQRDVEIVKRELPIDTLYFNYLTPLPGSEDHKVMKQQGVWMDPDFNKYNISERVTHHPLMTDEEFDRAYVKAQRSFFSHEHMRRVMMRMMSMPRRFPDTLIAHFIAYREGPRLEKIASYELGVWRIKRRRQRRFGMPIESPLLFYPKLWIESGIKAACYIETLARLRLTLAVIRWRWKRGWRYTDEAITPVKPGNDEVLLAQTAGRSTDALQRRLERKAKAAAGG